MSCNGCRASKRQNLTNIGREVHFSTTEPDTRTPEYKNRNITYRRHVMGHKSPQIPEISELRRGFGGFSTTVYSVVRASDVPHPPVRAVARIQPKLEFSQRH